MSLESFALNESDSVSSTLPDDSPLLLGGVSTARSLVEKLNRLYCGSTSVEVAHMLVSNGKKLGIILSIHFDYLHLLLTNL